MTPGDTIEQPRLPRSEAQVERLADLVKGRERVLILTHDNPDPDSVAGAFCLSRLLDERCGLPSRIIYGGIIGRSANRQMVNALQIPMLPIEAATFESCDGVVLVDTQPGFANNSLPTGQPVLAVVDHHEGPLCPTVPLVDVRCDYGAVTTILTEYLVSAKIRIDPPLATAICFGISTETQDLGREASEPDLAAFLYAFPRSDQPLLGRLRHPQLTAAFFSQLDLALRATRLQGDVAVCNLDAVDVPDYVSQVADELVEIEDINWILVTGLFEGRVIVSVRTTDQKANAGEMLRRAVGMKSRAGGHGMIAGGAMPIEDGQDPAELQARLTRRFLDALGHGPQEGFTPLIEPMDVPEGQKKATNTEGGR